MIGAASAGLALVRLGRLLRPTVEGPPWQLPIAAAAVLGAALTWWLLRRGSATRWVVAANLVGVMILLWRLLAWGTSGSPGAELALALDTIRFGAAPVLAIPGLVALLAVAFWTVGALVAVAASADRPLLAFGPGVLFYLQLATLDRRPPGPRWVTTMALLISLGLLATAVAGDPAASRIEDRWGRPLPRRTALLPAMTLVWLVGTALGSQALSPLIPESGLLSWRTSTGIGSGLYGGTSFNLFVGLQQRLLSLSDAPMFYARVSGNAPPRLYWRLITLDFFDGVNWLPGNQSFSALGRGWEREDWRFKGPTIPVTARVRIAGLREQLLPVLYSPVGLASEVGLISQGFRVREDGSVGIDVRTQEGWEYEMRAEIPRVDLNRLATMGGEFSPLFRRAAAAGAFSGEPTPSSFQPPPDDIDRWVELPDQVPPEVRRLAAEVTARGVTDFEKAVLLESWFRDPRIFTYSVEVSTGSGALDLAAWLTDPASRNYRTGYCEQFATAFAVMARTLGIPSRVVLGFAPGEEQIQPDGGRLIVVRERNAHAWVELWMDGQGWVAFDPTPRSDGINPSFTARNVGFDPRIFLPPPEEPDTNDPGSATPAPPDRLGPEIDLTAGDPTPDLLGDRGRAASAVWWAVGLTGLLSLIPGWKALRRRIRLHRLRRGDVASAWAEVIDRLRDLGEPISHHLTPIEIARTVHPDLVPLATGYSEAIYGGRARPDGQAAFELAEAAIAARHRPVDRMLAWFRPRSLASPP